MKNFSNFIKRLAPTLGAIIGGPVGATLGIVAKLAGALDQPEDASEEALSQALMDATPEQLEAIKRIDADTKIRLKELGFRPDELALSDTQGARNLAKETGVIYQFSICIALTIMVTGIVGLLFYIVMNNMEINAGLLSLLSGILGLIIKAWIDSLNFFTGTSLGSKMKSALSSRPF